MNTTFRTEVNINRSSFEVDYHTPILFIGSCFSDHIGGKLSMLKFPVQSNPFGVLYNPSSISALLKMTISNTENQEDELFEHNHLWHSSLFHGSFSNSNKKLVLENTNKALYETHQFLKNAKVLIITFGTAWIYRNIENQKIVANCHKLPASKFNRHKLSVQEIVAEWSKTIVLLKNFNPELKIIFTVSPVRHLKDGAHQNQLSKATLLLAIDELIQQNNKFVYFPSYEIIQDELRDYRFYDDDMLHISNKAVDYVFEKFKKVYMSDFTEKVIKDISVIQQALQHRILTNNSVEIQSFADSMLKRIEGLEKKYPNIKFELEKEHFKNLI